MLRNLYLWKSILENGIVNENIPFIYSKKLGYRIDTNMNKVAPIIELYNNENCPICKEVKEIMRRTCCGHIFCDCCISKWLNSNIKCPMCMNDLSEEEKKIT